MKTQTLQADQAGIAAAVELWRAGGLVAFPTETVYGLGADACNRHAVAKIFTAKSRPSFNPLIIHVADLDTARKFAEFDVISLQLANAFWPGPLSMVLPVLTGAGLSELVTAGLDTVAIRIPAHPLAVKLLQKFGGAIAAPSANLSGQISPTTAGHVINGLDGSIDAVIDDGPCAVGLESTIIMVNDGTPHLLRPGGLPAEILQAALGQKLHLAEAGAQPLSPGQLAAHYAPKSDVILEQFIKPENGVWLGFGPHCAGADLNLSEQGDLTEAAANLFAYMRLLDERANGQPIAVAPVPQRGLGRAINDRLSRAAA